MPLRFYHFNVSSEESSLRTSYRTAQKHHNALS